MHNPLRRFRRTRNPQDTLRLRVARGEVAEILPSDWASARSLDDDQQEVTRIIEALAARGACDRATGGHIVDSLIEGWHAAEVADIERTYTHRVLPTADGLVGAAEAHHNETAEALGVAVERMRSHAAAATRARAELAGSFPAATLPHAEWAAKAAARQLPHDEACLVLSDSSKKEDQS